MGSRRSFLTGLLTIPFVVRSGVLMPVRPLAAPPPFLPGDLIDTHRSHLRQSYAFTGARVVDRVEGDVVYAWNNFYGSHRAAEPLPLAAAVLFEGLPGNRVDNPSMRHRLIRPLGKIGLAYPEDVS